MKSKTSKLVESPTLRWRVVLGVGIFNIGLLAIFPNCSTAPMPEFAPGPGRIVGPIAGSVFYSPGLIKRGLSRMADRKQEEASRKEILQRKSYPEKEWNQAGLWEKTSSAPATYVPKGYGSVGKTEYLDGMWYVDPADSKRLFVPNGAWGNHPPEFWRAEAKKISDHLWVPPGSAPASLGKKQN